MGMTCTLHSLSAEDTANLISGRRDRGIVTLESCDLDKAWGAIHFFVSGAGHSPLANPESKHFLLSGAMLADVSEHVALHTPNEVAQFSALLTGDTVEHLLSRFDPSNMNQLNVYGAPWDASGLQYVRQFVGPFLSFIRGAASGGRGVMIVIC